MQFLRRINISAAIIALICFFLPWVQVSCGGARDSISGFDLARNGHGSLWLIALLMVAIIVYAVLRLRAEYDPIAAFAATLCGLVSAYLMNRERVRVVDESGLIPVGLTGTFWLGLFACLVVALTGFLLILKRPRSPG